ncbi:MAG: ABC transporter permease subunit [Bacillota bacterium]|nr:ABC transporter permease subunit [Bacillota bacterium]
MKEIIRFELHKSIRKPVVLIAFAAILLVDILSIFLGTFSGEPTYGLQYNREKVKQLQKEQSVFAGVINDAWIQRVKDTESAILSNPANQVSAEEREKITQELLNEGLSEDAINSTDNVARFVKQEVLSSREFDCLEEPSSASGFYQDADTTGKQVAENYRSAYSGEKGEALAAKAEAMYGYLSSGYQAYFDYDWGWSRLQAMQTVLPFTVAVFLLIVLTPLFSSEYAKRTDSLLLCSKYGKNKLIKAKIMTGFIIAISIWLLIQVFNAILVFSLFGIEGATAFVQNWSVNPSPYAFTWLTSYLSVSAMSFLGLLFLTSAVLFISSRCKNAFVSLIVGVVIILLPALHLDIFSGDAISKILMFHPAKVLIGSDQFKTFEAFYICGKVVMLSIAVAVVTATLSVFMIFGTYYSFKRHQVKN